LFIVRAIAKKHGGRVFAESEGEGRGATVVLELPLHVLPEDAA
jgi:two-component system, OmpR family, sensor histidine kinase SenX3